MKMTEPYKICLYSKKRFHYGSERAASSKLSLLLNVVEDNKIINVTYIWQRLSLTNCFLWTLCEEVKMNQWTSFTTIYDDHKVEKATKKMTSQEKKIIRFVKWVFISIPTPWKRNATHLSVNRNFF
jgi:hypothetical protein